MRDGTILNLHPSRNEIVDGLLIQSMECHELRKMGADKDMQITELKVRNKIKDGQIEQLLKEQYFTLAENSESRKKIEYLEDVIEKDNARFPEDVKREMQADLAKKNAEIVELKIQLTLMMEDPYFANVQSTTDNSSFSVIASQISMRFSPSAGQAPALRFKRSKLDPRLLECPYQSLSPPPLAEIKENEEGNPEAESDLT